MGTYSLGEPINFNIGAYPDSAKARDRSKRIRTIHEAESDPEFQRSKELIEAADKVYVLGFGFNVENTRSLFSANFPTNNTFGTAYGHTEKEIEIFNAISGYKFSIKGEEYQEGVTSIKDIRTIMGELHIYPTTITELFRNHHPIFETGEGDFSLYAKLDNR